jgi:hypothetical protein
MMRVCCHAGAVPAVCTLDHAFAAAGPLSPSGCSQNPT